jgi:hypothetical protein
MKKTTLNYKNLFILMACVSILSFFIGAYNGAMRERKKIEKRYIEVQHLMETDFSKHINLIYKDYIINGN